LKIALDARARPRPAQFHRGWAPVRWPARAVEKVHTDERMGFIPVVREAAYVV
jgi:hypothetical protein